MTPDNFAADRARAVNRNIYEWDHLPGLPAFCKGLPDVEKPPDTTAIRFLGDLANSAFESLMAKRSFSKQLRRKHDKLEAYDHLRPYGCRPSVADVWRDDREFARQRLNGVNPLQIERVTAMPEHLQVSDDDVARVLPGASIAQLVDQGRLWLCDWPGLVDVPVTLGRFLSAPSALFVTDDDGVLAPLAIQLDRDATFVPELDRDIDPVVFTPEDNDWTWLTARTHVQSADAAWHECVVHLFRTHLIMETFWVAANRGLAPQHPVHRLLAPHFAGTIAINYKARNELIVAGGPIDLAISVGTPGAYWLISQALAEFTFDDLDPRLDIERRGVDDREALHGYWYRDDGLRIWDLIGEYTDEVLRCFYPDDASVADDVQLQDWAYELTDDACGGVVGLPLENGRFTSYAALHKVVRQIIFTVSAEHSAVNNGQFDIFGWIPNAPGALFLPHPTSTDPSNEGELTYALPPFKVAETQIALVHLLSESTDTHLGDYPPDFFHEFESVRIAVDRFRKRLDELMIDIRRRNEHLAMPYEYLDPATIAASIDI